MLKERLKKEFKELDVGNEIMFWIGAITMILSFAARWMPLADTKRFFTYLSDGKGELYYATITRHPLLYAGFVLLALIILYMDFKVKNRVFYLFAEMILIMINVWAMVEISDHRFHFVRGFYVILITTVILILHVIISIIREFRLNKREMKKTDVNEYFKRHLLKKNYVCLGFAVVAFVCTCIYISLHGVTFVKNYERTKTFSLNQYAERYNDLMPHCNPKSGYSTRGKFTIDGYERKGEVHYGDFLINLMLINLYDKETGRIDYSQASDFASLYDEVFEERKPSEKLYNLYKRYEKMKKSIIGDKKFGNDDYIRYPEWYVAYDAIEGEFDSDTLWRFRDGRIQDLEWRIEIIKKIEPVYFDYLEKYKDD